MTTLRSITTLRSLLSATKCYRMGFSSRRIPFRTAPAMFSCVNNSMRTEQICWFSSSTVAHARRRDRTDVTATEDLDNEEEEKDDDEDVDSEQSEQEKIRSAIQQYNLPKGYRIIIRHVASLRLDLICAAGIGMGRSTIEEEFYGSKLRVNGEKSTKKAQQVKQGDVIDLVVSRIEGAKYNSKRIIVYKVFDEKSLKNKVKVCLIAWRQGIEVDGSQWS